jgi:hypothetical protein
MCLGIAEITHLRICRYLGRTLPQVVKYCQELNCSSRSCEGDAAKAWGIALELVAAVVYRRGRGAGCL